MSFSKLASVVDSFNYFLFYKINYISKFSTIVDPTIVQSSLLYILVSLLAINTTDQCISTTTTGSIFARKAKQHTTQKVERNKKKESAFAVCVCVFFVSLPRNADERSSTFSSGSLTVRRKETHRSKNIVSD